MKITMGILAHVDAGKTTFSERILCHEGVLKSFGRVDDGDSFLDYHIIERERGITVFSGEAVFSHGENTCYLVDTPGHTDFSAEMERTVEILDYAVLLISGTDGIQGHTETVWNLLRRYQVPTFLFVNKMDRETADFEKVLSELKSRFSEHIVDFTCFSSDIPEEVIQIAAERDETILDEFLDGSLSRRKVLTPLISMIREESLFPCFQGSALQDQGISEFIDGFFELAASDYRTEASFGGRCYKIRYDEQGERLTYLKVTAGSLPAKALLKDNQKVNQIRVYSGGRFTTVREAAAGDVIAVTGIRDSRPGEGFGTLPDIPGFAVAPALQAKVIYPTAVSSSTVVRAFSILEEEDPSLSCQWEESVGQLKISVMGRIQLEVLERHVEERFGFPVSFAPPEVLYLETITAPVLGYGHFEPLRHYAEVVVRLEPGPSGSGITFESECHPDRLAVNYQNLIRTHVFEKRHRGVLTGSPVTDIRTVLVDGRAHLKHTEGGDFREALYRAIRQGLMKAENRLMEPYYQFSIRVPQDCVGRVMSDITRNSGDFSPPQIAGDYSVIAGRGPVSTFMNYGEELMCLSGGRGRIHLCLDGYEACHNQQEVVEQSGYRPEADADNPSCSVFCRKGTSLILNWDEAESQMHCLKK